MTDTIAQPRPRPQPGSRSPRPTRPPDCGAASELSRRGLLLAGAAAGGAALLAACGGEGTPGGSAPAGTPTPSPQAPAAALAELADLERKTILTYTANAPVLVGKAGGAARTFLEDHRAHLGALEQLLAATGGTPPSPAASASASSPAPGSAATSAPAPGAGSSTAAASGAASSAAPAPGASASAPPAPTPPASPEAATKALTDAENAAVSRYVQALGATASIDLVTHLTPIMASEAQHAAAYAAIADPAANAVPAPFITAGPSS